MAESAQLARLKRTRERQLYVLDLIEQQDKDVRAKTGDGRMPVLRAIKRQREAMLGLIVEVAACIESEESR